MVLSPPLPERVAPEETALSGMQRAACNDDGRSCISQVLLKWADPDRKQPEEDYLKFDGEPAMRAACAFRVSGVERLTKRKPRRIAVFVCLSVLHTYVHVHVAQPSLLAHRGEEVAGRHQNGRQSIDIPRRDARTGGIRDDGGKSG